MQDVNKLKENLGLVIESLKTKESEIKKLEERISQIETIPCIKKENGILLA